MNEQWNKPCASVPICVALVVPSTACEDQPSMSAADISTRVVPDLIEAQEKRTRLKVPKTINGADWAKNPDGYTTVIGGPQPGTRISRITINQCGGGMFEHVTIPEGIVQTVISMDDGWPRSVPIATAITEDQQFKRLLVFD